MSWLRKTPDRGGGPVPDDDGKYVPFNFSQSPRQGLRVYRDARHAASIRLLRLYPTNGGTMAWVELRLDDQDRPIAYGKVRDLTEPNAAWLFLDRYRDIIGSSSVPWQSGLHRAIYDAVEAWTGLSLSNVGGDRSSRPCSTYQSNS